MGSVREITRWKVPPLDRSTDAREDSVGVVSASRSGTHHISFAREEAARRPMLLSAGVATSLLLAIIIAHLPLQDDGRAIATHFRMDDAVDLSQLQFPTTEQETRVESTSETAPSNHERKAENQDERPEDMSRFISAEVIPDPPDVTGTAEGENLEPAGRASIALAPVPSKALTPTSKPKNLVDPYKVLSMAALFVENIGIDEPPVIKFIDVKYPFEARYGLIKGLVVLSFIVETDGRAYQVQVLKPVHPSLDRAAVEGLREARFWPARRNGRVVPAHMKLVFRFRII